MIEASLLLEEKLLITQHWPDYLLIEHSNPHEKLYELHKQPLFIRPSSLLAPHRLLHLHSPITFLLTDVSLPVSLEAGLPLAIFTGLRHLENNWMKISWDHIAMGCGHDIQD